jgi:hypothetical protein
MARRARDAATRVTEVVLPSEQEMAIRRNYEARSNPNMVPRRVASGRGGYAMSADDALAAASLMDRSQFASPLAGLPVAASVGEFKEASGFFGTSADSSDALWDEYYDDDQSGYGYQNLAGSVRRGTRVPGTAVTSGRAPTLDPDKTTSRQPAPITIVPTSTTNPQRPRTVAAGYDEGRNVLTVVFRDGTFYNYYSVDPNEWAQFKASYSKGEYIMAVLDGKPRGTARMANASLAARAGLYRIARTGQWLRDGQVSGQIDRSLAPRVNPTRSRRRK